jgi:uncharacterized protein (TIGR00369 family)
MFARHSEEVASMTRPQHRPGPLREEFTLDVANERSQGALPGLLGIEFLSVEVGRVTGRLDVQPHHLAPNGFLHAASVIALADTACGFGCVHSLPEAATGFTTIEVKANYLGTATEGTITCEATMTHSGRTTQVWDATVTHESTGRTIALFRCTQMVLY